MYTCREMTEIATDYMEGKLPFRRRAQVQLHLAMCRHCRAYLRQMKSTVQLLGRLPEHPVSDATHREIMARFRALTPVVDEASASTAVARDQSLVASLERIGARQGKVIIGAIFAFLIGLLLAMDLEMGPMAGSGRCAIIELGFAAALVSLLGLSASVKHTRLGASTLAMVASVGAALGFGMVLTKCPLAHVAPHMVVVHLGGVLAATALGAAVSRLPVWR